MNWRFFALPVIFGFGAFSSAQIDVHSMLQEMTDLPHLSERPIFPFKAAQASSYDRTSTSPQNQTTWYANSDKGQYIRSEKISGRTEYVMADLKGPGAVVRLWSANPTGITIRFYFDGETTARMALPMDALLSGNVSPYGDPFGYIAGEGYNLYFPFPYAKSLKITAYGSSTYTKALYYHVGYRTYGADTPVATYVPGSVTPIELTSISNVLLNPSQRTMPVVSTSSQVTGAVKSTTPADLFFTGPGAIYELNVQVTPPPIKNVASYSDPAQMYNVLRNLILEARFDNELCVQAPLGDFFGSAPNIHPYQGFPFSVASDGTMTCRFVMPYANSADIRIKNLSTSVSPTVTISAISAPRVFDNGSYYFHSQWTVQKQPSRPLRDINLLSAVGEGLWVGDNLHVANVASDWWGQGDEKVWVDGESFPSTFGTGSEDFFGFAWCSPTLFARPYHGQPNNDFPANYGNTDVHRWNILDPIPYTTSLSFNIEAYSNNTNTTPTFAHTSYWYALPGGQPINPVNTTLLLPPQVGLPKSLQGTMVQAEDLPIASANTSGSLSAQIHIFTALGYKQLLWHGGQPGDSIVANVAIPATGTYKFTFRPRYSTNCGKVHVYIAGVDMGVFDLYRTTSGLTTVAVGNVPLTAGTVPVEFDLMQKNSSSTDNDLVLDWVLFQKQ